MSYPQDGSGMDERPTTGGSVRRARERAMAGMQREDFTSRFPAPPVAPGSRGRDSPPRDPPRQPIPMGMSPAMAASRIPRLQAPAGLQGRDGQLGMAISRPTQIPQWPLAGPVAPPPPAAVVQDPGFPLPPTARGQPPPRPARPSRVPSLLDGSKIQGPTPIFQNPPPMSDRESSLSVPQTTSSASRPSTIDSVGSIPDFPLPVQQPPPPPPIPAVPSRRSVNLGPPPSARRGASSFYSNASFVSPIPEESPRARSHTSYASSAAMPGSFGSDSPGPIPIYRDSYYDRSDRDSPRESEYEDDRGDESRLVRSASVGKRGKALLVTTPAFQRSSEIPEMGMPGAPGSGSDVGMGMRGQDMTGGFDFNTNRPSPSPLQPPPDPFQSGTGYIETNTSSSSSVPRSRAQAGRGAGVGAAAGVGTALTADSFINAYDAASSTDPSTRGIDGSPEGREYSRLSAIRRPPRLDIDAVRAAESRGSLTSLPDLIRRATRLAASLEKGRRPASRFEEFDFYGGRDMEKEYPSDLEKHQSGLSDMLAAFPPPAQPTPVRRSIRQSIRDGVASWPLPVRYSTSRPPQQSSPLSGDETATDDPNLKSGTTNNKRDDRRRCCGLPMWGFILVLLIIAIIVTAAVVVPIEFFVVRRANANGAGTAVPAIAQCQAQLTCANGGTNIVTAQGTCSCICTNGFTGNDCTVPGSIGCTTTNIVDQNTNIGSNLINNVTLGDAIPRLIQGAAANFSIPLSVTQILAKFNTGSLSCAAENALVTFDGQSTRQGEASAEVVDPTSGSVRAAGVGSTKAKQVVNGVAIEVVTVMVRRKRQATLAGNNDGYTSALTISIPTTIPPTTTTTVTTTISSQTATASAQPSVATFRVTEEVVDFARVGVLLVLQEESLSNAETAQTALQRLFNSATQGKTTTTSGVTIDQARNVTLGNNNTINLVNFQINIGTGLQGRGLTAPARFKARSPQPAPSARSVDDLLAKPRVRRKDTGI